MDIEIGDYVRTKSGIGKVEQIGNSLFWLEDGSSYSLSDKTIKHSKNIIDLIEVGDIVNGYRIDLIDSWRVLVHEARGINRSGFSIPVAQYEEDIENVLTHEQYIQNCYKVERS